MWTSLRLHGDGFGRFLVAAGGLGAARTGRLIQRLLEIETYRLMALLSLPPARDASRAIAAMDGDLSELTRRMAASSDLEAERPLLDQLFHLAAQAEELAARTGYRLSATRAYGRIVADRLDELHEQRLGDHQPLGEFLDRRFEPALRTCRSVDEQLAALGGRIARAADLLRTRISLKLEDQNQKLLASMDRRARLQIRLQETVEGLSVVAISYYLLGLLAYLVKGTYPAGLPISLDTALAIAAPCVLFAVWLGLRRLRRSLATTKPGAGGKA